MTARPFLLLAVAVALTSTPAVAQDAAADSAARAVVQSVPDSAAPAAAPVADAPFGLPGASAAPTLAGDRVGFARTARATERQAAPAAVSAQRFTQGQALMIVGGAAMLAGAIIDNDAGQIFMIGGAVVLLYGLYLQLQ